MDVLGRWEVVTKTEADGIVLRAVSKGSVIMIPDKDKEGDQDCGKEYTGEIALLNFKPTQLLCVVVYKEDGKTHNTVFDFSTVERWEAEYLVGESEVTKTKGVQLKLFFPKNFVEGYEALWVYMPYLGESGGSMVLARACEAGAEQMKTVLEAKPAAKPSLEEQLAAALTRIKKLETENASLKAHNTNCAPQTQPKSMTPKPPVTPKSTSKVPGSAASRDLFSPMSVNDNIKFPSPDIK